MTEGDASKFIVTLVHGTFAKAAPWARRDGTIGRALEARFGDRVSVEAIDWSGGNGFAARQQAAEKLRAAVVANRPGPQQPKHFVVAHSHGGNVVAYAARDSAVAARLTGVVTLASPFIVARRRNLGWTGKVAPQAFVLWLVLALFYLVNTLWGGGWVPWQKIAMFVALAALVEIPGLLLAARWEKSSEALLEQLAHGTLASQRVLILRAVADEATGVIAFLQLPSLVATLVLGRLAKVVDGYVTWCARLVERPLRALAFCLAAWAAMLVPGGLVMWLTGSELLMYITMIAVMCVTFGPVVFLLLRNVPLAYVTASGPIALLAAPVVLILAVTLLAYGPRFAMANMYLDLSAEASPIGDYRVRLLSPAIADDPDTPGGLLHSALYDDERAVTMICDFIAARLAAEGQVGR